MWTVQTRRCNQRNWRQLHYLGNVGLGLIIKWFLLTGLSSIMPRTLPNNCNILKASIWKAAVSLNPQCLSGVYSSLLIKIILKHRFIQRNSSRHKTFPVISYFSFHIEMQLNLCGCQTCGMENQRNFGKHTQGLETLDVLSTVPCRERLETRINQLLV